jgi:hypothetical protein
MKPVNVETLLNHSTGISDSYYRPRESELLEEYLAVAEQHLSVSTENKFKTELEEVRKASREEREKLKRVLEERDRNYDLLDQLMNKVTADERRIAALEAREEKNPVRNKK